MNLTEIIRRVNERAPDWERLAIINDRMLMEMEEQGTPDPLTVEHPERLHSAMDACKESLSRMEAALLRPCSGNDEGHNPEYKKAFCEYLRKGNEAGLMQLEKKGLSSVIGIANATPEPTEDRARLYAQPKTAQKPVDILQKRYLHAIINLAGSGKHFGNLIPFPGLYCIRLRE